LASSLKLALDQPYEGKTSYYQYVTDLFAKKKEDLVRILKNAPFDYRVLNPDGGYFIIVDITKAIPKIPVKYFYKVETDKTEAVGDYKALENPDFSPDYAFTRWLTVEYGVTPIPMFAFYNQQHAKSVKEYKGSNLVRIAICKCDETVNAVSDRLTKA
jgi:aspartate/methionine/tyrosine aminotransferase